MFRLGFHFLLGLVVIASRTIDPLFRLRPFRVLSVLADMNLCRELFSFGHFCASFFVAYSLRFIHAPGIFLVVVGAYSCVCGLLILLRIRLHIVRSHRAAVAEATKAAKGKLNA